MATKTQQQVLAELVKKLGYSSYNDLPVRSSLEEKLVQGTLTVRESVVLDMYSRGIRLQEATKSTPIGKVFAELFSPENRTMTGSVPSPESVFTRASVVINSSVKSGFTVNTPFREISNSREAIEKIAQATKQIDPHWSGVFQALKGTHTRVADDQPFVYQNPKEKAAGLASAQQSRGSKKFDGVPPAKQAFPEIVAGLSGVDDATTKNALIASSLAPYRPGEIANLRLGKYDVSTIQTSTLPGYFDIEAGKIVFPPGPRGNKAATDITLDKNSILYQTLASQAVEAESLGSDRLFPDMTTGKMTAAIQKNITPRMAQFEQILGRPFDESKDFRKLVASMIVGELGYSGEAEKMLGHTDAQLNDALTKVGQKHYISTIVRQDNPLAAVQLSLENMIGEAIGATTLNETAVAFGLNIPGFTDDSAQPVTITRTGQELSEKATVVPRQMTPDELASLDARREEASANARLAARKAEREALVLEEENLKRDAELQSKREAAAEAKKQRALSEAEKRKTPALDDEGKRAFQDLAEFFKGFGKMAVGGLGITAVVTASEEAYTEEMERSGSTLRATGAGAARGAYEVLEPLPMSFVRPQTAGEGSDVVPTDEEGRPQYPFLDELEAQEENERQPSLDEQIGGLFEDDADITITYPEGDK